MGERAAGGLCCLGFRLTCRPLFCDRVLQHPIDSLIQQLYAAPPLVSQNHTGTQKLHTIQTWPTHREMVRRSRRDTMSVAYITMMKLHNHSSVV